MFRAFSDVQTAEMLSLPKPRLETGKPIVVACPMSEEQHKLQEELVARYERIRSQKVDPREDNALAITTDGRKLALDARMLSATASDIPTSKVNALVEQVVRIWSNTAESRGTQIVFCDMGINPTPWGYSAYEEVIQKLSMSGIPQAQIASIGEADTDGKKQALFERVRSGQVRILLGSTQKMGTGTNVQKRLVALHHLDAPWKPAEVEQREGRILRQGNDNEEVAIYRYVTQGSFDAFMWQALETKARFIAEVMTGNNALRAAQDIGNQELSYAEVKAIASGNPAVLTLAEADAELQRLSVLRKNHADEQYMARRALRQLPVTIAALSERLSGLTSDMNTALAHAEDPVKIGGHTIPREEVMEILGDCLSELPQYVLDEKRVTIGVYRGLTFGLVLHPQFPPDLYLKGEITRQQMLSRDHHGPRAVLNALICLVGGYRIDCTRTQQDLAVAEGQLRDYQERLCTTFVHEEYIRKLTELRDQLRVGLQVNHQRKGPTFPPCQKPRTELRPCGLPTQSKGQLSESEGDKLLRRNQLLSASENEGASKTLKPRTNPCRICRPDSPLKKSLWRSPACCFPLVF